MNSQQDYQEPKASMWPSGRHQYGLQSQFGSPESLDPWEGKNVGLLFSSGRSPTCPQVVCPFMEGMTPFVQVGTKGQVEWEEVFGLSGGRWDGSNGTMVLRS